jgi:hypothetical protein
MLEVKHYLDVNLSTIWTTLGQSTYTLSWTNLNALKFRDISPDITSEPLIPLTATSMLEQRPDEASICPPVSVGLVALTVTELLAKRAPEASICPSEVARRLAPGDWRGLMPAVRAAAVALAREGRVRITRGIATLDPNFIGGGPIRLRRGARFGKQA